MSKVRLFISTDMQMISGVNHVNGDKDDVQSLIHALMYQDKVDIVGIASSTSKHQPGANDEKFIRHVIDQYGKDQKTLGSYSDGFKTAAELKNITYQGNQSLAGKSGYPAASEASAAIIREAKEAAAAGEKLYVATWGGLGDVARALHDAPEIAGAIRLLSASGPAQEPNAYKYIKNEFAGEGELWWVDAQTTQRGIYGSPDSKRPISDKWAEDHAEDHGALGDLFHRNTQDVRGKGDDYDGVKMGDSWTVFYLIDQANNNDPTAESWGGEYRKAGDQYWVDRTDQDFNWSGSDGARTTYEHRKAWTGDFAKRFDWLKGAKSDDDDNGGDVPPAKTDGDRPNDPILTRAGTVDGSSRADQVLTGSKSANSFFFDAAADSGDDEITNFGRNDVLVLTTQLHDGDGDELISFGGGAVAIDGARGADRVRLDDVGSLRAMGRSEKGLFVYATAAVRPEGAIEGALGDERLAGDAKDKRADTFFFDTALGIDLGFDQIANFGGRDRIVTTSKLHDGNGDGVLRFGDDEGLDLRSPDGKKSMGHVRIHDGDDDPVLSLELIDSYGRNDATYYVYGMAD